MTDTYSMEWPRTKPLFHPLTIMFLFVYDNYKTPIRSLKLWNEVLLHKIWSFLYVDGNIATLPERGARHSASSAVSGELLLSGGGETQQA